MLDYRFLEYMNKDLVSLVFLLFHELLRENA